MSDDNIIDFKKKLKEKTTEAENTKTITPIQERIVKCASKTNCKCNYCSYREGAKEMILDLIYRDMGAYERKTGAEFATFDIKLILFNAISDIIDMEDENRDDA